MTIEADQRNSGIRPLLMSMAALLASYGFLMMGTGLFNTFIGVRADLEGFTADSVGYLTAAYFAGLAFGSQRCETLINRIGHIRAFAAYSSIIATVVLAFPFVPNIWVWALFRALIGFNVAGVFMVAESWLNHKSTPSTRGTLLSMYMMTSYVALAMGQFLMNAAEISGNQLFMLAAMLFGLAVVPVAVTRSTHPPPVESAHVGIRRLYEISPVAFVICFGSGLSVSSLWGLGPIFGRSLGMDIADVSTFMGIMILGAMLFQYPIGKFSDLYDRRKVIFSVCLSATLVSVAMFGMLYKYISDAPWVLGSVTTWTYHRESITLVAALYGGVISTLYPLSVSYANDYVRPAELVPASAGLVLLFGAGAAVGPIPAGWFMKTMGASGLFVYLGIVACSLAAFVLFRMRRRTWVAVGKKESFVALPEATSTPSPLEADPRADETVFETDKPRYAWILDRRRYRRKDN